MRSTTLSRYAFVILAVAMGLALVLLATAQAHLYEGGTVADRLAAVAQDTGFVLLLAGAAGILFAAVFICRSARLPECLFYAGASATLVLATLLVVLITGLNVHSWTFLLVVPTLCFTLCVLVFLVAAAHRKIRPPTVQTNDEAP